MMVSLDQLREQLERETGWHVSVHKNLISPRRLMPHLSPRTASGLPRHPDGMVRVLVRRTVSRVRLDDQSAGRWCDVAAVLERTVVVLWPLADGDVERRLARYADCLVDLDHVRVTAAGRGRVRRGWGERVGGLYDDLMGPDDVDGMPSDNHFALSCQEPRDGTRL